MEVPNVLCKYMSQHLELLKPVLSFFYCVLQYRVSIKRGHYCKQNTGNTVKPPIKDPPRRGHNRNNLSTKSDMLIFSILIFLIHYEPGLGSNTLESISITNTNTFQNAKYKYKYKYIFLIVFEIQIQNTSNVLKFC